MNSRDELLAILNAGTGAAGLRHIVETIPLAVYIDAADEQAAYATRVQVPVSNPEARREISEANS